MRWAGSGADGRVLDREREREREKGRFLARPTAVVPTIGWSRGGAAAWSWSILFPTIERPETTPMRWAESGADEDGQVLDREREREREVFGAPDCSRSDYRLESWRRGGVVLVNSLSDY